VVGRRPRARRPRPAAAAAAVDAEHPLFILYTSGSTGKPKGVLHTSAGYLAGAYVSARYVFDLRPRTCYWCTADIGWITGHSYVVYGPLANGATILIYEGAPNAPDPGRFWRIIERHRVTILYTAPTAIRAFMRWGDQWPAAHDLRSLRLLGTVGEPIGPEAWHWYHRTIGGGRCPIVDTWWQTETGSIMLTTLPGAVAAKPGSHRPAVLRRRHRPSCAPTAARRPRRERPPGPAQRLALDAAHDLGQRRALPPATSRRCPASTSPATAPARRRRLLSPCSAASTTS
jgi:acyl-coenzyme A synthetase/AMP-(fatty) acid ligase